MSSASTASLDVVAAWPGNHLFDLIGKPRVSVRPFQADDDRAPDLVVIPAAKAKLDFVRAAEELPAAFWNRIATGRTVVVLDSSTEGHPFTPDLADRLHRFLLRAGLPRSRAVYVTQDRSFRSTYEARCTGDGLGEPIHVLTYDYFIKAFFKAYETNGAKIYLDRLAAFRARQAARPKRFISLNLSARPTKVLFLLQVMGAGLWDRGFISWGAYGVGNEPELWREYLWRQIYMDSRFNDLAALLAPYRAELDRLPPTFVGATDVRGRTIKRPWADTVMPEHDQSWFTVVTESEMEGGARTTEKPFRPLVNFHPALVLGNPGSLDRIRELGFHTFTPFIDEDYDAEPDLRRRFDMVWQEMQRLCDLGEDDLASMAQGLTTILKFNAKHGLTRVPTFYRDRIDEDLLSQVSKLLQLEQA